MKFDEAIQVGKVRDVGEALRRSRVREAGREDNDLRLVMTPQVVSFLKKHSAKPRFARFAKK